MNTSSERIDRARLLEIRNLIVASGDGHSMTFSSVLCPARQRTVPLEACADCERGGGLADDPAGRTSYVSCGAATAMAPLGGEGRSAADMTPVSWIMTTQVVAVRPDLGLDAVTALFLDRDIGGAPVVDSQGRSIGVISKTDLLRARHEHGGTARTVADAMNRVAFTLSENASVSQAAALMAFEGVHRVPVASAEGQVVGILTTLDILRWLAQQDGYLLRGGGSAVH